jgi:hypothetical protein
MKKVILLLVVLLCSGCPRPEQNTWEDVWSRIEPKLLALGWTDVGYKKRDDVHVFLGVFANRHGFNYVLKAWPDGRCFVNVYSLGSYHQRLMVYNPTKPDAQWNTKCGYFDDSVGKWVVEPSLSEPNLSRVKNDCVEIAHVFEQCRQ